MSMVMRNPLGVSEIVGAVILLLMAVMLGVLVFAWFSGYVGFLSSYMLGMFMGRCSLGIASAAINTTNGLISSLGIFLFNYGHASCSISSILLYVGNSMYVVKYGECPGGVDNIPAGDLVYINATNLGIPYKSPILVKVVSCDGVSVSYAVS